MADLKWLDGSAATAIDTGLNSDVTAQATVSAAGEPTASAP